MNGAKDQSSTCRFVVSSAGASRCTALNALVEFPHSQRIKTLFSASCNIFSGGFFVSKRAGELTSGRVAQSESERSSSGFSKVSPLHQSPHAGGASRK